MNFQEQDEKHQKHVFNQENQGKIDLSFKDLDYNVKIKDSSTKQLKSRQVLKKLNGICKSGELCAIMGASGAGKTSLLNILACRITNSPLVEVSGKIEANRISYDSDKFNNFAAYVMQSDLLLQTQTPEESLRFAANLRLDGDKEFKEKRIQQIISEFRLNKAKDTYNGGKLVKGISGGERKRTSIAVDLITNPQVILLDEPTSGLDSFTAFLIVNILKRYAIKGKTVIMTIHQPSLDIYELFDRLFLMVQGKFIYQGLRSESIEYFKQLNFIVPKFTNPTDYFMDIMHSEYEAIHYESRCDKFFKAYQEKQFERVFKEIDEASTDIIAVKTFNTSFFQQVLEIAKRNKLNILRNPILFKGRFGQTIFLSIIAGIIYYKMGNEYLDIRNRTGALFFVCLNQFMTSMQGILLTFPSERELFLKEENSKMYSATSYFFGRTSMEIPLLILMPLIFVSIFYFMMDLRHSAENFFILMLILLAQNLAGNAVGLLLGASFNDPKVAGAVAPGIFVPLMLFSGFYKQRETLPIWLSWIEYISPFKYAWNAAMINEFEGQTYTRVFNGNTIIEDPLKNYGFDLNKWQCIGILFCLGLIFRILALLMLRKQVKKLQ